MTATMTFNGIDGTTSILVAINQAPSCLSPPCLTVQTINAVFPVVRWELLSAPLAIYDDDDDDDVI